MVLSRQLGSLKKTRSNHDVSDLQVGALESALSSRLPSWMTVQNIFSQWSSLKSEISKFPSFQLFWVGENVFNLFCLMVLHVNVYYFKLGKENLKPRLGPHTLSTE
jgi:hypothetical protein